MIVREMERPTPMPLGLVVMKLSNSRPAISLLSPGPVSATLIRAKSGSGAMSVVMASSRRGAAIIAARGLSSAASAANALVDHVRSLVTPGAVHSIAVKSEGRYGFDANVWAGMPVRTTTPGSYEVITGYAMDDFAKSKIATTNKELAEERAFVAEMIA